MSDKEFIKKYLDDFSSLVKPNEETIKKIIITRDALIGSKKIILKL